MTNDYAHEWTDKQLASLEKKISREYGIALKEMKQKQTDFMKGYEVGLSNKKSQLTNGEISKQEFNEWLDSQALRSTWLNDMVNSCSQIANNTNKAALDMVNGSMAGFYAENYNWGTYQIEKGTNINTAFNLVDADTVRGMLADNPNLLPKYNLDTLKDLRWNNQKFNSAILQGILQGESIPDISKRLKSVMQMNHNSAVRNARTATTAAENKGRIDSYKRAEKMGIEVKKEWLATLDGRTRHSHRQLDGVSVGTDEKFANGCRFPGDPQAPGFEVYNCRCTLVANLPDVDTSGAPRNSKLGNMSYDEWKNEKKAGDFASGGSSIDWKDYAKKQADMYASDISEIKKMGNKQMDEIGEKNAASVVEYTGGSFEDLNSYKRGLTTDIPKTFLQDIENMDEAFKAVTTDRDLFVKRECFSIDGIRDLINQFGGFDAVAKDPSVLNGAMWMDKAYLSSTINPAGAGFGDELTFYLYAPKGTHGIYIGDRSYNPWEDEFIFQAGQPFVIRNVEFINGKWTMYAEALV